MNFGKKTETVALSLVKEHFENKGPFFISSLENDFKSQLDKCLRLQNELNRTHLRVGIWGGTGVGKSSLINHLAKKKISKSASRRPMTSRALVFVHENNHLELPESLLDTWVSEDRPKHNISGLEFLTLIDLPDIDSRITENAQCVHAFIPFLDVLIYLTTPEKYSDKTLLEALNKIPLQDSNILTCMNKIDLVPKSQREKIFTDFNHKNKQFGIENPFHSVMVSTLKSEEEGFKLFEKKLFEAGEVSKRKEVLKNNFAKEKSILKNWQQKNISSQIEIIQNLQKKTNQNLFSNLDIHSIKSTYTSLLKPMIVEKMLSKSWFPLSFLHFLFGFWQRRKLRRLQLENPENTLQKTDLNLQNQTTALSLSVKNVIKTTLSLRNEEIQLLQNKLAKTFHFLPSKFLELNFQSSITREAEFLFNVSQKKYYRIRHWIPITLGFILYFGFHIQNKFPGFENISIKKCIEVIGASVMFLFSFLSPTFLIGFLVLIFGYFIFWYFYARYKYNSWVDSAAGQGAKNISDDILKVYQEKWLNPQSEQLKKLLLLNNHLDNIN